MIDFTQDFELGLGVPSRVESCNPELLENLFLEQGARDLLRVWGLAYRPE